MHQIAKKDCRMFARLLLSSCALSPSFPFAFPPSTRPKNLLRDAHPPTTFSLPLAWLQITLLKRDGYWEDTIVSSQRSSPFNTCAPHADSHTSARSQQQNNTFNLTCSVIGVNVRHAGPHTGLQFPLSFGLKISSSDLMHYIVNRNMHTWLNYIGRAVLSSRFNIL